MALSLADTKLLWARAAGRCSRPGCGADLTRSNQGQHYVLGEQAHVVAQSKDGPRAIAEGGPDTYENMILLCPTCHSEIDKRAELFPVEAIVGWKRDHEACVAAFGSEQRFSRPEELASEVRAILEESHAFFREYGPNSIVAQNHPNSNVYRVWGVGRAAKLVPNNTRIVNMIKANSGLLTSQQRSAFPAFIAHAEGFAHHVLDRLDYYPLFPREFDEAFQA